MIQQLSVKMEALPQPTIAALNVWTVCGGLELSVACDIRIASNQAQFSKKAVPAGFVSEVGAAFNLAKLIGKEKAQEMILTGRPYNAEEVLRMGLVDRMVPHDQRMSAAMGLPADIAVNPWLSVRYAKQLAGRRRL